MIKSTSSMQQTVDLVPILITIAGVVILLLLSAVSFFVIMFIRDVKSHTKDISKLFGITQTQNEKYNIEMKALAERTELQIQQVTKNVGELAKLVEIMVKQKLEE